MEMQHKMLRNTNLCDVITAVTFNITVINVWPSHCLSIFDVLSQKIMFILIQGSEDFLSFYGNPWKSFISLSVPEHT